jgi:hypothetical protein
MGSSRSLKKLALFVLQIELGVFDADGVSGFAAQGNLHAVNGIHGGVAGRSAAQRSHHGVGHKSHVHQVVLHGIGKVEGYDHCGFANV